MRSIAIIVTSTLAAAAFAVAVFYHHKNSSLAAKLSSAEFSLAVERSNLAVKQEALNQAIEARIALESHLDRVAADAEHWRKKASDLAAKEGANESLNPYERAVLDSLRDN